MFVDFKTHQKLPRKHLIYNIYLFNSEYMFILAQDIEFKVSGLFICTIKY
jgi:hypothetical protein